MREEERGCVVRKGQLGETPEHTKYVDDRHNYASGLLELEKTAPPEIVTISSGHLY